MSDRIWGLTLDSVENLPRILAVLKALPRRATVRIVCDPGVPAHYYEGPCEAIAQAADILLAPVDSFAMKKYNTHSYVRRFQSYLGVLGKYAKYCEAGNELGGDWLGRNVALKVTSVLPLVKAAGLKSMVTYFCDNNMLPFIRKNPIAGDLVSLSYYPNASECDLTLDDALHYLERQFPTSTICVGEYGSQDGDGRPGTTEENIALVRQLEPHISGGFWWMGYQDLVQTGALLPVFKEVWK